MYYLQSRYYDPAIGRFINADTYVSTGEGFIGCNMFAYCNNNPIINIDSSGKLLEPISALIVGTLLVAAFTVVAIACIPIASNIASNTNTVTYQKSSPLVDVYEHSAQARTQQETNKKKPQVHHIAPVGSFSTRSPETQQKIAEIHNTMSNVGINRYIDPNNLMLVSSGIHATLHTDAYISHVHSYITTAGNTRKGVYLALFFLRLEIAAMDTLASGF